MTEPGPFESESESSELVEYVEAPDGSLVLKGSLADPSFPAIALTEDQLREIENSITAQQLIEETRGQIDTRDGWNPSDESRH